MTGAEFRKIREEFRLSQTELGTLMGVVQVSVSRWENAQEVPSIPANFMRVLDIATKKGIPLEEILPHKEM